jgi:hypothetical protein
LQRRRGVDLRGLIEAFDLSPRVRQRSSSFPGVSTAGVMTSSTNLVFGSNRRPSDAFIRLVLRGEYRQSGLEIPPVEGRLS